MATTGTTDFNPSTADLMLSAFGRLQIRRTEITQQHLADAANESNFLQVEWASRQPNLWTSNLYTIPLVTGTATYTLPASMICFQAVYITTTDSSGTPIDRIMMPLSAFEYAAMPNKTQEAPPTQYWYNRQITPQITLWPVPDDSATYTLNLRYLKQIEDASFRSGTTPQIPYRWIDAFVTALAARLAAIYKPEIAGVLEARAERAWGIAAREDTEDVPLYIIPGLSSYVS